MRYVGSKNRISKELAPIIQSHVDKGVVGYLEPFVGGGNMIDKINHENRHGSDIHEELIELLKYAQAVSNPLPISISEEEYYRVKNNKESYEKWYVGLVGFCASFGAKYFGGYARDEKSKGGWSGGAIRALEKQRPNLTNIKFNCCSFLDYSPSDYNGWVIYCDIPYKGTLKYSKQSFPYDQFYSWAKEMSKNNIVLISEYSMPDDFLCVWQKETKCTIDSGKVAKDKKQDRVEKLFMVK